MPETGQRTATKAQLERRAAELGATLDYGDYGFNVDTPQGFVWKSNGCSTIANDYRNAGGQTWKPKAYGEALEMMAHGIEPAENADDPDAGYWWSE